MEIEQLVIKAQKGDKQAYGEIYDMFADRIFRFIRLKVKQKEQAEDILQDTFLKAWSGMKNFHAIDGKKINFSGWLYKITYNCINDYFREYYRKPETLELNEEIEVADSKKTPMQNLEAAQDIEAIKEAMHFLPGQYKQILELRFIEDMEIEDIAQIMGKTNLAVRIAQHRALSRLRKIMENKYALEYKKI
jgi:RNA polymerase sigma-70 factor (ECF subfamily)